MRKEFSSWAEIRGTSDAKMVFLTGDLGFAALENVGRAMGPRFVNMGVAEQNMVSVAAGLAQQGLSVLCYSIAPFAVFRPAEQTRLDVCIHGMDVKIVGNGGGYGYGIMGASHHALEDLAVMSSFPKMRCYIPFCGADVPHACEAMMARRGPAYLRLGMGVLPASLPLPAYAPIRKLFSGSSCTIVGVGPVILNVIAALESTGDKADVFAVSELPLADLGPELIESLRKTGKLLVVEEHVRRGGLGEHLALLLMEAGVRASVSHLYARGYPGGCYGSQSYHQSQSGLDARGIAGALASLAETGGAKH